ncbi:MAG: hypothetical protein LC667_15190 [Thioalkalivibrio sp.]|nr:hypothetical protein [Thioalkalivibrio sp.]
MRKTTLLIATLAVSLSCALPRTVGVGGEEGPGNKTVSAKEEPVTLIAADGTVCVVTGDKFNRVKTGDRVWCNWRPYGSG